MSWAHEVWDAAGWRAVARGLGSADVGERRDRLQLMRPDLVEGRDYRFRRHAA